MSRDPRKLRVFLLADELSIETYCATTSFAPTERFCLQLQIREAAVSAASNIVEGSAKRTTKDYLHFLTSPLVQRRRRHRARGHRARSPAH